MVPLQFEYGRASIRDRVPRNGHPVRSATNQHSVVLGVSFLGVKLQIEGEKNKLIRK
jgi:hypothetical protein